MAATLPARWLDGPVILGMSVYMPNTDGFAGPSERSGQEDRAATLYLDLLARVVTNTLFEPEPDANQEDEFRFVHSFIQHYMNGPAIFNAAACAPG